MLKRGTLIKKKQYQSIISMGLVYFVSIITSLISFVLGGLLFDEEVVSAIEILCPVFTISYGLTGILIAGNVVSIGKEKGEFNLDKANKLFSQSLIISLVGGVVFSLLLYFAKEPFLQFFGCSQQVYEYASQYYNYFIPLPLVIAFEWVFVTACELDGDTKTSAISQVVNLFSCVILSIIFSRVIGAGGIAFGIIVSYTLSNIIYLTHFLRKDNTFKFCFYFNIKDALNVCKNGLNVGLRYVAIALSDLFINAFIIYKFGDIYLCAYAVYNVLTDLYDISSCIFEGSNSISSVYYGERNNDGVKRVMALELRISLIIGFIYTIFITCFAKQIPYLMGMSSIELYEFSVRGVIYIGCTSIVFFILNIVMGSFGMLGHFKASLTGLILYTFVFPALLPICLSLLMGFDGFSIGIALNPVFALIISLIVLLITNGKKGFPLYLQESDEKMYSCDLQATYNQIDDVCDFLEEKLKENKVDMSLIMKIRLMCEEIYTRIIEKNEDKIVITECYLMIGTKYIRMIVRDNGKIHNYVDMDNKVESFNAYCLALLITNSKNSVYSYTNSLNRNGLVFYRS